jgi:micrococcal nuclease
MKIIKSLQIAAVILSLSACSRSKLVEAEVVRIIDGDGLEVVADGQTEKIRFACVDAPEWDQPWWGDAATLRVSQLAQPGSTIYLDRTDTDRYGRTIAEVFTLGKESVNLSLTAEGLAPIDRRYLDNCPDNERYVQAETAAKDSGLGIWGDPDFAMPWDWRKR